MNLVCKSSQRGAGLLLLLIVFGTAAGYYAVISFSRASQQTALVTSTTAALSQAKEALIGYAASHIDDPLNHRPYLPCPDKTAAAPVIGFSVLPNAANDGIEDRNTAGGCSVLEGNLPWVTLGITGLDGWASRFRYRPTPAYANSVTGFTAATVATLQVNNAAGAVLDPAVPVVIVSHGPNGWGATSSSGTVAAAPPAANVNETDNANGANTVYVSNAPVEAGQPGGEFDDVTVWISQATLIARMQPTGLVP
jgi:type II secretory pathway pseudopilin PulG